MYSLKYILYHFRYKNEDRHGCYHHYNFIKDYFYFATSSTTNKDVFTVTAAIADDGSREAAYLKTALPKYKNKDSLCQPPLAPEWRNDWNSAYIF